MRSPLSVEGNVSKNVKHVRLRTNCLTIGTLVLITFVGLVFRLNGNDFGIPSISHEEFVTLGRAWAGNLSGGFNPGWFAWPSLVFYLELFVLKGLRSIGYGEWSDFVVGSRSLEAVIGALTILLIYSVSSKIFNQRAGIIASFLVAILPPHVFYSHIARPEVLVPFFYLLVIRSSINILKTGKLRFYIFSLVSVGLATSAKYNGAFSIIVPFTAHYVYCRTHHRSLFNTNHLLLFVFIPFISFMLSSPYSLLDYKAFIDGLLYQAGRLSLNIWEQMVKAKDAYLDSIGLGGIIASLIGIGYAAIRPQKNRQIIILLASLISSMLLIVVWNPSPRLLLTSMVLVLIFAAGMMDRIVSRVHEFLPKYYEGVALILLSVPIVIPLLRQNLRLVEEFSRRSVSDAVMTWISDKAPAGSDIHWGYEAPAPIIMEKGKMRYTLTGDIDPDELFHGDYERFRRSGYEFMILSDQHRTVFQDPGRKDESYNFYTQLYDSTRVIAFQWDRLDKATFSAPNSQMLRSAKQQLKGSVYVLELPKGKWEKFIPLADITIPEKPNSENSASDGILSVQKTHDKRSYSVLKFKLNNEYTDHDIEGITLNLYIKEANEAMIEIRWFAGTREEKTGIQQDLSPRIEKLSVIVSTKIADHQKFLALDITAELKKRLKSHNQEFSLFVTPDKKG